jgi:hypothetical protein
MARMAVHIGESRAARKEQAAAGHRVDAAIAHHAPGQRAAVCARRAKHADDRGRRCADDRTILATSARLYGVHRLRRVYYSAFSPIPDAARALPLAAPPTVREHRLYQADWLMRFYGFTPRRDRAPLSGGGMLALDMDPKLAWALAHRERFPVNLNTAPRELLLRVPGFGVRILQSRRVRHLRAADLLRLHLPLKKVMPFVLLPDHHPGGLLDGMGLGGQLRDPVQPGLFDEPAPAGKAPVPVGAPPQPPYLPPQITALATGMTALLPTWTPSGPGAASVAVREERSLPWA